MKSSRLEKYKNTEENIIKLYIIILDRKNLKNKQMIPQLNV